MYLNSKLLETRNLSPAEFALLLLIKQNKSEPNGDIIEKYLDPETSVKFEEMGLVDYVKEKSKKDRLVDRIRLSPKGTALLEDLQTPDVTDGDIELFNYLSDMYLNNEDDERSIGNKKLVKMYVAQFRQIIGLSLHEAYWLYDLFLKEYSYTKKLEYLFLNRAKNHYGKFSSNYQDSPIYQFWDDNKERVEKYWELKIK